MKKPYASHGVERRNDDDDDDDMNKTTLHLPMTTLTKKREVHSLL